VKCGVKVLENYAKTEFLEHLLKYGKNQKIFEKRG